MSNNKTEVVKDLKEKSILVAREFDAPIEEVWLAYTESDMLDQWWGPKPWRAETKNFKFIVGGQWLYAMVGPEGQRHWSVMNYLAIDPMNSIDIEDAFSDESGKIDTNLPVSKGRITFSKTGNGTRVEFKMYYATEEDVHKLVEMGFEQGISICMDQLEDLLKKGQEA